jgi:transposase
MSTLDHTLELEVGAVRRLEVITGVGGRRRWSDEMKARIVHEAMRPGAVVSQIARRYGLTPQQVFTWRRLARRHAMAADHGPAHLRLS